MMSFWSCKSLAAFVILVCFCIDFSSSSITSSKFIKDPEFLLSPGNTFRLGFFSPDNSTKNRYVGIWYNQISVLTPIWVANRNKPLNDSSGVMKVLEDGNLVVLNGENLTVWSSELSNGAKNSTAKLTDDGNLVLQDDTNGYTIWESFQQPGDTIVKNMKIVTNEKTRQNLWLTSWKGPLDPAVGSFSVGIEPLEIPQLVIWNGSIPYWRSGPWNSRIFIGIPNMDSVYLKGFTLSIDTGSGTYALSFTYSDTQSPVFNFFLSSEGKIVERTWNNKSWELGFQEITNSKCDIYGICGEFGICNSKNEPICSCLNGFEPKNALEWRSGNWTGGCVRRTLLQCERVKNGSEVGKEDGFWKMVTVKVPDFVHWSSSASDNQECRNSCLNNCSCLAYSFYNGFGCMYWTRNLIDLQQFSSGEANLYLRLAYSELDNKRNYALIIGLSVAIGVVAIFVSAFFIWKWMPKYRKRTNKEMLVRDKNESQTTFSDDRSLLVDTMDKVKLQELPVMKLQKLAIATGNFDISNRLGQGGFGPVYKGKLEDGQEIAVKRLSKASGQGLEEFMNEVMVISKLQHRNLVRLFGCCAEGDEKMLVYEFMPNKSLDVFLFDPSRKQVLDWRKRFNIIEGICRGLMYLHRDSRLRIIHRDLKASNILLDQDLNPKISDFGLARIFSGNEVQANTRRVVGTYGYMSPEYAMEGRFSEKSDVFSLGVLLLEIVSGRRNTSFYENDHALSLLGFAWKLWNECDAEALVDPIISDPSYQDEIFRCIHVSLLCVQEFAKDRPSVSTVISMLNSEILDLPPPKQPAFTERQFGLDSGSSQQSLNSHSVNNVTLTVVDGR